MELNLEKIFEKADKTKKVDLVTQGDILFLVLNTKLNILTTDVIQQILLILDQVEKIEGQKVLVTVSSGKVFSAGYNLKELRKP